MARNYHKWFRALSYFPVVVPFVTITLDDDQITGCDVNIGDGITLSAVGTGASLRKILVSEKILASYGNLKECASIVEKAGCCSCSGGSHLI